MGLKLDLAGFIGVRNVVRKEKVRVRRPGTELTAASFGRKSIALQTSPLFIRLATASNLHSLERRLILDTHEIQISTLLNQRWGKWRVACRRCSPNQDKYGCLFSINLLFDGFCFLITSLGVTPAVSSV